jgi:hypothetical protein
MIKIKKTEKQSSTNKKLNSHEEIIYVDVSTLFNEKVKEEFMN